MSVHFNDEAPVAVLFKLASRDVIQRGQRLMPGFIQVGQFTADIIGVSPSQIGYVEEIAGHG
jgi:hypothetical protein